MKSKDKLLMRAMAGETLAVPPVWMMRQAGRYLPEYRATRAEAGSFLDLCYNPDLATEVTLQPIRRYGFDAAILFADILLVPQALGADLKFVEGEGPRLSTITDAAGLAALKPVEDIHETLSPVYETVRRLAAELPAETALIGFAGAPWTVATYMIAGRGTPDQAPARRLMYGDPATFDALMDRITEATIAYLLRQIEAGAETVKMFDSWAGALPGEKFEKYAIRPAKRIVDAIRAAHPGVPVIGFPARGGRELRQLCRGDRGRVLRARHVGRSGLGGAGGADEDLRAGQSRSASDGDRRRRAERRGEALRGGFQRGTACLQSRARDHAGRRSGQCGRAAQGDPGVRTAGAAFAASAERAVAREPFVWPAPVGACRLLSRFHVSMKSRSRFQPRAMRCWSGWSAMKRARITRTKSATAPSWWTIATFQGAA